MRSLLSAVSSLSASLDRLADEQLDGFLTPGAECAAAEPAGEPFDPGEPDAVDLDRVAAVSTWTPASHRIRLSSGTLADS